MNICLLCQVSTVLKNNSKIQLKGNQIRNPKLMLALTFLTKFHVAEVSNSNSCQINPPNMGNHKIYLKYN